MKIAGKEFSYYWDIIKIPVFVLIGWGILGTIVMAISYYWATSIFNIWTSLIVSIALFSYIAYRVAKDNGTTREAAYAGAITGVITGFIGAIVGIITFYAMPQMYEISIQEAVKQGVPETTIRQFTQIMIYAQMIMAPILNAIIGAAICALSFLIVRKSAAKR